MASANEDESADSKDKYVEEVNNDEDSGQSQQAEYGISQSQQASMGSEDANTDHKEEPEVNNSEDHGTTESSSKALSLSATDNAGTLVTGSQMCCSYFIGVPCTAQLKEDAA
ncbi:hypothetical protein MTO96_001230 [Rhipicephalus appendiculatus]